MCGARDREPHILMNTYFSAFRNYRDLPKLWGPAFLPLAFIGRLPTSMIIIGVLTLVTTTYGIGDASLMSAVLAIAIGIGQPLMGKWTDHVGQRLPLLGLAPINAGALLAFVYAVHAQASFATLALIAVAIGVTTVPVGGLMRIRWYPVATTPRALSTALSYETVADEMNFVLGPAIVGILATAFSPSVPLIVTAIISATCITSLGLHRSAPRPERRPSKDESVSISSAVVAIAPALGAMMCLGAYFGAMQTATTASAESFGAAGEAGLIYAAMGLGAAITALSVVAIPDRFSQSVRIGLGAAFMTAVLVAAPLASTKLELAFVLFVLGLGIGPASVAMFTLAGQLAPAGGAGVAMTAMGAINVGGVSIGAALAGRLAETSVTYSFWVALAATAVMSIIGFTASRREKQAGQTR